MSLRDALRVEFRVATSRRAQPVWFRVVKWTILIVVVGYFWRDPRLWRWLAVAFALSVVVHLVWRTKTKRWTQPWGGWNDLDAPRGVSRKD